MSIIRYFLAGMAELVDAMDLGSIAERREGSNPFTRTNLEKIMSNIKKIHDKKLKIQYSVGYDVNEINQKIDSEAQKQQEKVKLDGFRRGQVPLNIIKEKFFVSLLNETAQNLVEESVDKLIKDNNYKLITRPEIKINTLEKDKNFEFEITFNLYPEIPEIKYEKIKLKKYNIKISNKEIEDRKNKIVKSRSTWTEQNDDYLSKNGDKLKIDFLGKIDDVPFDGGKAENYNLELGSKTFIDNFEDQLIGKKKNEEVQVKVKFPKDYQQKNLANKNAVFEVKIKSISTPTIPELTNDFVKENFNLDSVEKFNEEIESELKKLYEIGTKNKLKTDIFDWFKKNIDVDLPENIVDDEFNREWKPIEEELKTNPNKFSNEKEKQKEMENIRKNSEESIKLGLILSEIGKINNIELKNTEVNEEIRKRASAYPGQESMIVDFYTKNKNALNQLTGLLLEDKVIDFITEKSSLVEEEISFEDFEKLNNK